MCLSATVGPASYCVNRHDDVRTVQILLNTHLELLDPIPPLKVDGDCGKKTLAAIAEFGRRACHSEIESIGPEDKVWLRLTESLGPGLTKEKLRLILPHASEANVERYFPHLVKHMAANGINTPLRIAHFLAQIGHESGSLRYTEEIASGEAYEGRAGLGNTQPGDGVRFKGRGLIQITGRANYEAYGKTRGVDYTGDERYKLLATDPSIAVDCSCWFWRTRRLNELADQDDAHLITRRINGGYNGLDDRLDKTRRAKYFLVNERFA